MNQKVTPRVIGKRFLQVSTPTRNAQMSEPQFTEQDWRRFLASWGEDPDRAGLVETPSRAAKAWKHWTAGYDKNPAELTVCRAGDIVADREKGRLNFLFAQLRGGIESTAGMYGDLQGIAGKTLPEIEGLDIPLLNAPKSESEEET